MRAFALISAAVGLMAAASVLQGQDPLLLPAGSVVLNLNGGPGGAVETVISIEESGLIPYAGRGCSDGSTGFDEVGGQEYGNNEWTRVSAYVQRYGPDGRATFDMIMDLGGPELNLAQVEAELRGEPDETGLRLERTVTNRAAGEGRILITRDVLQCIEDQYPSFEQTSYEGYAVVGTAIVYVRGGYNSGDPAIAERIHAEVLANAKTMK